MKHLYTLLILFLTFYGWSSAQDLQGFFLDDAEPKSIESPEYVEMSKPNPSLPADVAISINATDIITEVSKHIYGNNANVYMTQMYNQPALISHIRKLSPQLLRFPGGNLSSVFFWNSPVGEPPADAPEMLVDADGNQVDPSYWYGTNSENWTLSVENYYKTLDSAECDGVITINYGYARYGTGPDPVAAAAHLAADWVRYDNGRTKFWEIGNESSGPWQAGFRIDPELNQDGQPEIVNGTVYGKHFKVFVDSMKAAAVEVGAEIYIGAQLIHYDASDSWNPPDRTWNEEYFAEAGNAADFYIVHNYYTPFDQDSSPEVILETPVTETTNMMNYVKQNTTENGVEMKPLTLTEWNIFAVGSKQMVSHINGLHASMTLGELIKNKYGMACRWDLANGYDNGNDHGIFSQGDEPGNSPKWNPRPPFFHMYFFQKYFGDHMVSSTVSGSEDVLTYTSSFASGQIGLTVINRSRESQTVELEISNFGFGERYYIYSIVGDTENGDFSERVIINGVGPDYDRGGPINDLENIKALSAPIGGLIKFESPALSAQYILVENGSNQIVPVEEIDIDDSKSSIDEDKGSLQLSATVSPANAGEQTVTWSISDGQGLASVTDDGLLTAIANGTVVVRATANDGSGVYSEITVTITNQLVTGIGENLNSGLTIYPNPTESRFAITNYGELKGVSLKDLNGRELLTLKNIDEEESIDVSFLPSGIYVVQFTTVKGNHFSKRIIKK